MAIKPRVRRKMAEAPLARTGRHSRRLWTWAARARGALCSHGVPTRAGQPRSHGSPTRRARTLRQSCCSENSEEGTATMTTTITTNSFPPSQAGHQTQAEMRLVSSGRMGRRGSYEAAPGTVALWFITRSKMNSG